MYSFHISIEYKLNITTKTLMSIFNNTDPVSASKDEDQETGSLNNAIVLDPFRIPNKPLKFADGSYIGREAIISLKHKYFS